MLDDVDVLLHRKSWTGSTGGSKYRWNDTGRASSPVGFCVKPVKFSFVALCLMSHDHGIRPNRLLQQRELSISADVARRCAYVTMSTQ